MEVESNYYDPEAILAEETVRESGSGDGDGDGGATRRQMKTHERLSLTSFPLKTKPNHRWSRARSATASPRWPRCSCRPRTAET
jgi:hypothetical protein